MKIRSIKLQLLGESPPQYNFEFHFNCPISFESNNLILEDLLKAHVINLQSDLEQIDKIRKQGNGN